jgi:hypothetical protein
MFMDVDIGDVSSWHGERSWQYMMVNRRIGVGMYDDLCTLRNIGPRWTMGDGVFQVFHEPGVPVKGILHYRDRFLEEFGKAIQASPRGYAVGFADYDIVRNIGYTGAFTWKCTDGWPALVPGKLRGYELGHERHLGTVTVFRVLRRSR